THEPNGNAVVHINVPESSLVNTLSANAAPQQMAMIKSLLAGAHVVLGVEPEGVLVRTNSAWVEGPRVTLLDIDLDQVLKDDTLAARLQAAKTAEELKAVLKEVPGLKLTLEKEITIEFTPK